MKKNTQRGMDMYQPLADLLRPQTLDEVYGQEHILGKDAVLRRLIDSGKIPNMVFYGPSGTGKTTVANIIAKQTNRTLYKLNATTASTADIKEIVSQLDTFLAPNGVLLYLDEIQSFNKKQQQSLLEYIENGKITLIASTTENPYFYVFNAILSRSTVFEFKQISAEAALQAVRRAVGYMEQRTALTAEAEPGALEYISGACGGDLRKAMNAVEVLFSAGVPKDNVLSLTLEDAKAVTQKSAMRADRDGDNHYDLLSALQKSIRGSDPDAACHYLARLLEAGQMQSACRRLMVIAAEDVGLAYPTIIPIVNACVDMARSWACRRHGSPWEMRRCSWPPAPSPIPATSLWMRHWQMSARARAEISPGTCKTSTPTATPWSGNRGINTPMTIPTIGCSSNTCRILWWGHNTTNTAPISWSRRRRLTGTRSKDEREMPMDIRLNDILVMKKPHPCGEKRWLVLRTGADFRLRCLGCGHEVMTPRHKAEKNIRTVERPGGDS